MSTCEHVVVPGSYDPITYGHIDVIRRACKLFDTVTVAIAASKSKRGVGTVFSLQERYDMVVQALEDEGLKDRVQVKTFDCLLVDFCKENQAQGIIKGLRAVTDFEYELQQATLNAKLAPEIESIFVMSGQEYAYVSSSAVREIASMGSDVHLLVPEAIQRKLKEYYG